jgi:hypothetical protein
MGWIVFEALLALGVLLALVWWTLRMRREHTGDAGEPGEDGPQ